MGIHEHEWEEVKVCDATGDPCPEFNMTDTMCPKGYRRDWCGLVSSVWVCTTCKAVTEKEPKGDE